MWENNHTACLSKLWAIEGVIQHVRWHNLDETKKRKLKKFHQSL